MWRWAKCVTGGSGPISPSRASYLVTYRTVGIALPDQTCGPSRTVSCCWPVPDALEISARNTAVSSYGIAYIYRKWFAKSHLLEVGLCCEWGFASFPKLLGFGGIFLFVWGFFLFNMYLRPIWKFSQEAWANVLFSVLLIPHLYFCLILSSQYYWMLYLVC